MKRMERIFSVPLKGGAVTDVYSAFSLAELHESLRAMGSSMLFVADDNTERFLPDWAERVILPHGERWKNWESEGQVPMRLRSRLLLQEDTWQRKIRICI